MEHYILFIWLGVFVVTLGIEAATADLASIWFSAASLVAMLIAVVVPELVILQIIVFLIISIALLLFVRPTIKNYLKTNKLATNSDSLIGKYCKVVSPILVGERGSVKIEGKIWTAISNCGKDLEKDQKVKVLAIQGNKLIVEVVE